jgi:hypothetical protein
MSSTEKTARLLRDRMSSIERLTARLLPDRMSSIEKQTEISARQNEIY